MYHVPDVAFLFLDLQIVYQKCIIKLLYKCGIGLTYFHFIDDSGHSVIASTSHVLFSIFYLFISFLAFGGWVAGWLELDYQYACILHPNIFTNVVGDIEAQL